MGEWQSVRIEDIAKKIAMGPFGSNIKVETFVPTGVPIISGQHLHGSRLDESPSFNFITEEHAERLANSNVFPGDVVFTHAGTIGQVALIPQTALYDRYVLSQRQFYLRVDASKADPAFVARWFHSPIGRHRLLMHASQVGVPSISRPASNLKAIEIELPSLHEQKAISAIFDVLDDKIDLNRRMNETLEAMARALFKDWFVDFGPTRAKMEGREPYLAQEIWDLFPDKLDDDGKPEGWEVRPVSEFAELKGGKQLAKEHISDAGPVPVFGGAGIMGFTSDYNADGFVISVGRVGAYCGQFFSHRGKAWINNNASLIRPKTKVSGEWLFIALQHIDMDVIKKGAAQPFVSNGDIAKVGVIWPGDVVINAFSGVLVPLMQKSEANESESRHLAQTRDLLLPKLMSGEVRVANADQGVQEAR